MSRHAPQVADLLSSGSRQQSAANPLRKPHSWDRRKVPAHPAQQTSAESSGGPVPDGPRHPRPRGDTTSSGPPPPAPDCCCRCGKPPPTRLVELGQTEHVECPTEPARTAPDPISPPKAVTQRFALGRDLWSHAPNAPPHAPLTRSTHLTQRSSTRRQRHLPTRRDDHPHRTNAGSSVRSWWLPSHWRRVGVRITCPATSVATLANG